MKPMWVKKSDKTEPEMYDWLMQTEGNCYDPAVLTYPATSVLKAENGKPIMYMPVQTVYMPDALGFNPDASVAEKASALQAAFQVLAFESRAQGCGEIYFLCREESTQAFAERHGLERIDIPLYRLKI